MNKLKHISFAGIDSKTNPNELLEIQKQYPMVEFGVLMSGHWYENGNRYLDPKELHKFKGLNLCGHLCGKLAKDMMNGNTELLDETYPEWRSVFKRIQVNVAPYDLPNHIDWKGEQEMYIQCKPGKYDNYEKSSGVGMLIDNSGGRGIEEKWTIYPTSKKIGYAGGLNPENVVRKTRELLDNPEVGDFWIDMESGVRTDDWFDLEKVRNVLKSVNDLIPAFVNSVEYLRRKLNDVMLTKVPKKYLYRESNVRRLKHRLDKEFEKFAKKLIGKDGQ